MITLIAAALMLTSCGQSGKNNQIQPSEETATVYLTKEISPEALVRIYKALSIEAKGRVAVKMSTGEVYSAMAITKVASSDQRGFRLK